MATNPYGTTDLSNADPFLTRRLRQGGPDSSLIDSAMGKPADIAPPDPSKLKGPALGPPPTNPSQSTAPGIGGGVANNYTSPTYVEDLIRSYGNRPGANPSVKNDPGYWLKQIQANGGIDSDSKRDYWTKRFMTPEGAPAGGPGAGGPGAYVPGQGVPGQGTVFGGLNPQNPRVNVLQDEMAKIMAQAEQPVTPQDQIIRSQVEPYAAMEEQGVRNLLSSQAEKMGPNANPEAVARSAREQASQATSAFQGQAMQNELGARRQQLQQLLQDQSGLLTEEQRLQLQEELSQLGLAQQVYQYDTTQGYLNSPMNPNYVGG